VKVLLILPKVAEPILVNPTGFTAPAIAEERRTAKRLGVHWGVRLFGRMRGRCVESTTKNLSTSGFYCVSLKKFKPGHRIRCEITIPNTTLGSSAPLFLECQVTVRRTESLQSGFGLGCRIEQYSVCGSPSALLR